MHVNQKSISRQIITQKKLFASCAHASKNTAQSWDASPKLTKYRSETTPQAVHVYVHRLLHRHTSHSKSQPSISRYHQDHERFPHSVNQEQSRAIQHIQISIVKQTTMHVNQKSISRQIITQKKLFLQAVRMQAKTQLSRGTPHRN